MQMQKNKTKETKNERRKGDKRGEGEVQMPECIGYANTKQQKQRNDKGNYVLLFAATHPLMATQRSILFLRLTLCNCRHAVFLQSSYQDGDIIKY
jgi:hypothetical protein